MTNKEKIEEIVIDAFEGWSKVGFTYDEIIAILSKLADWKDQQFRDAINSTLDYFDRGREAGFVSENSYNDMKYFASKITNKLFGKE